MELTADQLAAQARIAAHMAQLAVNRAAIAAGATPTRHYTETRSTTYGRGRRYSDQRGATQYDTGSGAYSVQIWDED